MELCDIRQDLEDIHLRSEELCGMLDRLVSQEPERNDRYTKQIAAKAVDNICYIESLLDRMGGK